MCLFSQVPDLANVLYATDRPDDLSGIDTEDTSKSLARERQREIAFTVIETDPLDQWGRSTPTQPERVLVDS